jgi:hypothetical protein
MRRWRSAGKRCELVGEHIVRVECYAGYKGDERPVRLCFREKAFQVVETEDRWYAPGATFFRVVVDGGERYVLRHEEAQDVWSLIGYRSTGRRPD